MGKMLYNRRHGKECAYGCCRTMTKNRKLRNYHGVLRRREKARWVREVIGQYQG